MTRKKILIIAALSFYALALIGALGNKGIYHLVKLKYVKSELDGKISALEKENLLLKRKVDLLTSDQDEIKRAIHTELGFIKDNEMIFEFKWLTAHKLLLTY